MCASSVLFLQLNCKQRELTCLKSPAHRPASTPAGTHTPQQMVASDWVQGEGGLMPVGWLICIASCIAAPELHRDITSFL